ncbi:MAG TPA: selenocysteine-specific translation elongation factor [Acidimicrobiales bacterium]|nr:selenocysteine-specific translation elongation factor [Acidimicrobiales bacterium]
MRVVATAGHVDHGKSTLVLALTGTDPDRFAEEKARGLTIDLGFAWCALPSGEEVAFVDVPGHVRFIKNMLAGVGAVDACLFVVAATEGWKPQSEEHLRILELLGVRHGVVALTKVGLVDDEWHELAHLELAEHLAGTFLADADVVDVDALDAGRGIDDLRAALDRLVASTPAAVDRARPRLWVDRAFAARGSGTVVTGTLAGGALHVGHELTIVPGDHAVRVRALQSLQRTHDVVAPGSRVAVNLTGVAHGDVRRGDALVEARRWRPTRTVDASLRVLASLDHDVTRRGAYAAYLGAGEYPVAVRLLGDISSVAPGDEAFVRLHLPVALPLLPGDRYVLREHGRGETVGGGEVLDVAPVLSAARARPSRDVDRVVAERGWVDAAELEAITGERRHPTVGRWVTSPESLASTVDDVRTMVDGAGALGLDVAALDDRQRAVLATLDDVAVDAGRARRRDAAAEALAGHPFLAELEASPFAPPDPVAAGVDRGELRELVRRGLVVERDGIWFAPAAIDDAARVVARLLRQTPEGVTASAVREALGTTRKYALPLLAVLDTTGVTRRRGDVRIGGPRLPPVDRLD